MRKLDKRFRSFLIIPTISGDWIALDLKSSILVTEASDELSSCIFGNYRFFIWLEHYEARASRTPFVFEYYIF